MATHVRALAWINIGLGVLGVLMALLLMAGAGIIPAIVNAADLDEGEFPAAIIEIVLMVLVGITLVMSLPCLIVGYGLLNFRPWGRILGIVLAALNLLNIPFGTVLSLYAFWVLLKPETEAMFRQNVGGVGV